MFAATRALACANITLVALSMKRIALFIGIAVAAYIVYGAVFSATVRYRLTLQAEVDGQPKSGSGIIEVTYSKNNDPISQAAFSIAVRGEAVVLDLGPRGALFALLKGDTDSRSGPEYIILKAFNLPGGALPSPVISGLQQVRQLSGKRELALTSLPLLVRFRDPNDPKTVERVDPLDLEGSFGAGVKLVHAELEIVPAGIWPLNRVGMTGEPITSGIERKLSWLSGYYSLRFDGQRYEMASSALRFANSLSSGSFKAGF